MTTMRVQIDGKDCEVVEGTTIFEAAQEAGIEIPRLCHRENLPATSACRLCVVEVDGAKNLSASCSGAVTNDMVISTTSDRVIQSRKLVLELLLSDH
ncbi:MAG: 2Fe-2S iron-sulfur cluster-binding protein, partial [SAR202 cluster bacterium]|nr:2Fe-2S iron-sulfur cluster-binding protein [SAR202 cluster bacterium]